MNDVIITKTNGGLGRRNPSDDMVSGLLANGLAVVGGVQLDTVYRLKGVQDALALLITPEYDTTNSVLVYEHINEFFRINPNGDLYILLVAQTTTFTELVDPILPGNAKKLLIEAEGKIKQLAVAYNPTTPPVDFSVTEGAILKAQELADSEYTLHRPIQILLEGKGYVIAEPVDFRIENAKNVSVMIGQSSEVANREIAAASPYLGYGAVGTLLGAVSRAAVNENVAWVEKFNVYGGTLSSASVGGILLKDISDGDLETLNDNGAIFFRQHIGRAGYYFNDSHTATALTSDYAYIENNRTIDKAVRSIRSVLLPRLASPVLVDPDTGKLPASVIKSYENDGRKALELMQNNNEISSFTVFVDPEQNILALSELQIQFSLIPTGTARNIKVTIGFSNPF